MKTTSVALLALVSASALAKPTAMTLDTRDIIPSELTDLEARASRVNWHKVGSFAKGAGRFGASVLFRRDEDGELLARDFDDYLETRDDLEARKVNWHKDGELLARDFDDDYLEARDFDEYLEARDPEERSRLSAINGAAHAFQHGHHGHHVHFHASQQDNNNNDRRDLQERSRLSEIRGAGRAFRHGNPGRRIHFHAPQQQDNDNNRRDLTERSRLGSAGRIGENVFHHAHQVHQVASYIPQRQNNNNNNRNQRRDLLEAGGLYDLD